LFTRVFSRQTEHNGSNASLSSVAHCEQMKRGNITNSTQQHYKKTHNEKTRITAR
jgi:hypothetical protein